MRTALILLLMISSSSNAQTVDTVKQLDQLFSHWSNATPGGMVQITRGSTMLYNKAFGLADLEHNTPNTTETISESGSVAKQFTAMATLLLASEGKLNVTDDVRKFIPELPQYKAVITVQQLLNHTSGLRDWGVLFSIAGWPRSTKAYTNETALRVICDQQETNFIPGTEYSYSNSNYVLLTFIVERVTGKSLADYTTEKFFKPLGMTHTKWRNNFREVIPNRAIAYNYTKDGFEQLMPFENAYGPGGLLTTTSDLSRWNSLLENPTIGGKEVYQKRIEKGKLKNGNEIGYAAGLFISAFNGLKEISHTGATAGYRALLSYYPEKKLSIAILSNDSRFDASDTDKKIAELFFGIEKTPIKQPELMEVSAETAKKFEGIFKSIREHDVANLISKDNKLLFNDRPIKAIHKDTLFAGGTKWFLINPLKLTAKFSNGDTISYKRVNPPINDYHEYVGNYRSFELKTNYTISMDGKDLILTIEGGGALKLSPVFKDGFTNDNNLYEFKRYKFKNSINSIYGLEVSMPRAEKISFAEISPLRKQK